MSGATDELTLVAAVQNLRDWPNLHLKGHPPQDRYACFKQKTSNQPTDKAATVNEVPKSHLTVVNRFSGKATLSVPFPEKPTFSTEST